MHKLLRLSVYACLLSCSLSALAEPKKTLHFGVFSYLGEAQTYAKFAPIVAYLNQQLEQEHLILEVMPQQQLFERIEQGTIDLVATNPTHFLVARQRYPLSGVIATLVESNNNQPLYQLGGAIITLEQRSDLTKLTDLTQRKVGIPSRQNMGGYRAQAYELFKAGVNLKQVEFVELGTHQAVIEAVLNGKVDAGFIRDGILESMLETQQLSPGLVRLIHPQSHINFPHQVSTALYPEWPIFALAHVDERSVRHIASALYSLEPDDPAAIAADIYGFTIPADYLTVEALARSLRLPPFEQAPDFTFADTWERWANVYWLLIGAVSVALLLAGLMMRIINREKSEHQRFELLLSTLGEGVYGTDQQGNCTFVNPAALSMLGLTDAKHMLGKNQHTLFHHHYPNGQAYPQTSCPIHKTGCDGQTRRVEEWFIRANGEGFPVNLVVTPLHQEDKLVGSVVVFQDITERRRLEQQLVEQARFDALTGLANRRYLLEAMQQEHARIQRHHRAAVVIMADLDHFKRINDEFGHACGDEILKAFAELMRSTLRKTDFIGRLGGEEFVMLLPETGITQAQVVAERLRKAVERYVHPSTQGSVHFTVSLGLTQLDAHLADIDMALAHADTALYQAKQKGRNRIEVYSAKPE